MNTDNTKVNTNLLKENEALKERIKELEEALQKARSTIKVWHGDVAWDLYQNSPEMKMINNALNPKTKKCKICKTDFIPIDKTNFHCVKCNAKKD